MEPREHTTRHTRCRCLNCDDWLDTSTIFDTSSEPVRPSEGDITVCLHCRHVMAYREDLTLRNLTDEEVVEIAGDPKLVATVELLGLHAREKELETRRKDGRAEAGDDEARRQISRQARRAAQRLVGKSSRQGPSLE